MSTPGAGVACGLLIVDAAGGVLERAPGIPPGWADILLVAGPIALLDAQRALLVIAFARRLGLVEIDIGLDLGA